MKQRETDRDRELKISKIFCKKEASISLFLKGGKVKSIMIEDFNTQ
jgi:hypothetical protein